MAKASKQQAAEHHQEILDVASHLFRQQGVAATSVPQIMQAAGMTHGGFYGHFASKEALATEAITHAFKGLDALITAKFEHNHGDAAAARRDFLETYLSAAHRDNPASGCVVAALGNDIGRNTAYAGATRAFVDGLQATIAHLADDPHSSADRGTILTNYATLVGALTLARATAGTPLSDEILQTVKADLLARS